MSIRESFKSSTGTAAVLAALVGAAITAASLNLTGSLTVGGGATFGEDISTTGDVLLDGILHFDTTIIYDPSIRTGTADPNGTETAMGGSLYLRNNGASSELLVNTTASGQGDDWTSVALGATTPWTLVVDSTLTSGALTGWTSRSGTWTANGTGFHQSLTTATEEYLSYETLIPQSGFTIECEILWPAGSSSTGSIGLMIYGQATGVATGDTAAIVRRDGAIMGTNVSNVVGANYNPALGTIATDTWHTLKVRVIGDTVSFWWDGVYVFTDAKKVTSNNVNVTRIGLWNISTAASYRNFKVWKLTEAN